MKPAKIKPIGLPSNWPTEVKTSALSLVNIKSLINAQVCTSGVFSLTWKRPSFSAYRLLLFYIWTAFVGVAEITLNFFLYFTPTPDPKWWVRCIWNKSVKSRLPLWHHWQKKQNIEGTVEQPTISVTSFYFPPSYFFHLFTLVVQVVGTKCCFNNWSPTHAPCLKTMDSLYFGNCCFNQIKKWSPASTKDRLASTADW